MFSSHTRILIYLLVFSFFFSTSTFWVYETSDTSKFHTFFDVAWWWIVTSTTVGYGDIAPVTTQGRLAAIISILVGMYTYTNFVTTTANIIHDKLEEKKRGKAQINCKNHILLCEYTAFADELINEVDKYDFLSNKEIVILSNLVETNPYKQHHFVYGVPISPFSLKKANVEYADYIFVFSNIRFANPDLKTLHIVSRIQKMNKNATIFVELEDVNSHYLQHLQGVNKIIPIKTDTMFENLLIKQTLDLDFFIKNA
ncbi:MAG: ion channel [Candidatus Sericytochromatia bacterium]